MWHEMATRYGVERLKSFRHTRRIARKVVAYFNEMGKAQSSTVSLSPRELQVLELLAKGAASKHIADQLSLSIETIRIRAFPLARVGAMHGLAAVHFAGHR
jgi:DNA-binding NarL/FixJ family response regulator